MVKNLPAMQETCVQSLNWDNRMKKKMVTHCNVLTWRIPRRAHELLSIELMMHFNHLIFCHPLLLLPSIFPRIRLFSNESSLHIRWPKDWSFSFSFSNSPSNEYSGLISFRIYRFDLLVVQVTLKSLHQHHSLKAPILWC